MDLLDILRLGTDLSTVPLHPDPLSRRDPAFIRKNLPVLESWLSGWHGAEVDGMKNIPAGPALCVGTHNGGSVAPDMFALMLAFWRTFGVEAEAYGLAHDFVFRTPGLGRWLYRVGAVPANPDNAVRLLGRGVPVLVYPGGAKDAFKPFSERHRIKFAGRRGFLRVAVRAQVPIIPVVSVGAHELSVVLTDGERLAALTGSRRVRFDVMPITLGLPTGVMVGPFPVLPLPTKVRVRVLPPFQHGLPASAEQDDSALDEVRTRLENVMQVAVDELVAEGDFGLRARWEGLLGRVGAEARLATDRLARAARADADGR